MIMLLKLATRQLILYLLKNHDIYSFFENSLDNAIEAVLKANKEDRTIIINVVTKGSFVVVHIENYCIQDVKFENGMPQTNKDKTFHGYGIKSIARVVKKYNGSLAFRLENNIFSLNALFPLENSKE